MTSIRQRIIFLVFVLVLFPAGARADVVYLKNGQKVKGEIMSQNSYSYTVKVNGTPRMYYINEVEKVLKGEEPAAPGEEKAAPEQPKVAESKVDLILRFMEVSGVREYMTRSFAKTLEQAPEKDRAAYQAILQVDPILKRLAPIYDKYYTEDDLKELINFYSSPAGIKYLQSTPKIMDESLRESVKYFEEISKEGKLPK